MFKKSLTIGKIADIPIKIHISFLIILPFLAWAFGNNIDNVAKVMDISYQNLAMNPYVLGLILAVALFVSVALHELVHSLVARNKGIGIENITLMLLGGVSQMEELTDEPKDEAWMALSGPVFSVAFGLLLLLIKSNLSDAVLPDLHLLIFYLGQVNIFLGFFNLLPAFPTDGGRVLRAIVAQKTSYIKATRIASNFGKFFAFVFAVLGLIFGNFLLILIGFFIFIGATQEFQNTLLKNTLSGATISDLMTENVKTVAPDMPIAALLDKMFEEKHTGYPVMEKDNLVGCVTLTDIKQLNDEEKKRMRVADIMSTDLIQVTPGEELDNAFEKLMKKNIGRLLVVEENELKGIVTRSDIFKGFQLKRLKKAT